MQQSAADSRAEKQYQNDMEAARLQRQWQLEDRDEARTYSRQVLGQLVTDAEAAGFNPLSVLRNGGASNYNAAAGFAPLSRQAPVKQEAGDYMGAAVANAGQSVGDFLKDFDPFRDNKREQESRLIESQIASLNASTLSGVKHGRGNFASGDFDRSAPRKGSSLSKDPKLGSVQPFKHNDAQVTNPWGGIGGETNPRFADAQNYEDRYGEVGGSILGGINVLADGWTNLRKGWKVGSDSGYFKAARTLLDPFPRQFIPPKRPRSNSGGGGW